MGQNLTGQLISNTYQNLVQISGSVLTNGLGANINNLTVTASNAGTAGYAVQAGTSGYATTAGNADTSGYADQAGTSGYAAQAGTSGFAVTASFALNVLPISTGSFVTTASVSNATTTFTKADGSTFALTTNNVNNAVSASYANTASVVAITDDNGNTNHKVLFVNTTVATNGEALLIDPTAGQFTYNPQTGILSTTASFAQTASFALNATPAFPYTGIASISGSLQVTGSATIRSASFNGDLIDNLTTPTASNAVKHVVALSSTDYSALASPDPNTFYIINDVTGSLILGDTIVSGSLTVTGALNAPGLVVPSASYAQTASLALNALSANNGFPYTGSAVITGSLVVTGSLIQGNTGNTVSDPNSAIIAGGNGNSVTATQAVIIAGVNSNTNSAGGGAMIATDGSTMSGGYGLMAGCLFSTQGGTGNVTLGGESQTMSGDDSAIVGGATNTINSGGNRSAIIAGQNNTVGAHTGSVIIGGTGLSTTKNEEVVVPNLTVSGSLDLSGSLNIQSNNVTNETIFQANFLKNVNFSKADYTYIITTNGSVTNIYISESATYFVSSSAALTTSASVNLYYYPEMLSRNEVAFVYFESPARATSANVYQIRTLPTITGSGNYWYPNTAPGGATTNIAAAGSNFVSKRSSAAAQNCNIMFKDSYDQVYFSVYGSYPIAAQAYINYTSSQGTPL